MPNSNAENFYKHLQTISLCSESMYTKMCNQRKFIWNISSPMLLGKKKILFRNCNLKCLPTTSKTNQVNYIAGDLHFIVTKCVSCTGHSYMLKYSTRKMKELLRLVNSGMMVTEISSCIQAVSGKVSPNSVDVCKYFF